ncbi:MAG: methyltransferase domain-containing protein, partial [Spirochaetia bacterium]
HITKSEMDTFLSILNPSKEQYFLDLCCGQGRHTFELSRRGYMHVYGLDRSHYLIAKAKKQVSQEGWSINFKEGDARKLQYGTDFFDYILILGNSFGYFESRNDDKTVLREALRTLKPMGRLLIDVTDGEFIRQHYQARSWEWIDKDYFVCRERCLSKDEERLVSREVITHVKKGVVADQFYAERLYSQESIRAMLEEAGFSQIEVHTTISPDSQRNQDLGMMVQRIIVTAAAKKEWSKKVKSVKDVRAVAVLLGDPHMEDKVKPDGSFDDDDFYTINELKKSLAGLHEYRFSYYNNHINLVNQLVKNREKIDFIFNLCDEGYKNEATKELHIPAMCEMLEIPYSGGSPQCLAFCYDKSLVRGVAQELDLPVPQAFIIKPEDTTFIEFPIQFPVIVKPNMGDSSIGISRESVCHNIKQLENVIVGLRAKIGFDTTILIEEFLSGKDLSVGIIGNLPDSYTVLPIIEEDYSGLPEHLPRICGYEAKWDPDSPYWKKLKSVEADLSEENTRFLIASCLKLFARLDCRDYARFDWRLDRHGTPRLLEVNPNPGWCWDGHLAKMAKLADITYKEMLSLILKSCEERINQTKTNGGGKNNSA